MPNAKKASPVQVLDCVSMSCATTSQTRFLHSTLQAGNEESLSKILKHELSKTT